MDSTHGLPHDFRAIPVDTNLSDYRVERILGQGSFGITYLALDTMLNKRVAIKEYFPREFAARDGTLMVRAAGNKEDRDNFIWGLESFLKEARVLALFDHPNIVPVRRFFEQNGTAYLVMDYCDGIPLDEQIRDNGPLTKEKVSRLLCPVLDALELIHKANFLHRDIKPANIFIKEDGSPVLLDFGAARHDLVSHSKSVTSLATPGYGAIEQYSTHGNQGPWTDIYGFGTTLYRAITGKKPDDATDRLLDDKLIPVSKLCTGRFDDKTLNAIDAAIVVRPENRPQSISEWRNMFGAELSSSSTFNQKNIIDNEKNNSQIILVKSEEREFTNVQNNSFNKNNKLIAGALIGIVTVGILVALFIDKKSSTLVEKKESISPVPVPLGKELSEVKPSSQDIPVPNKSVPPIETKKDDQKNAGSLPPCQGDIVKNWNNCRGNSVYPKSEGDTHQSSYVGDFKNGLPDGKGMSVNGLGSIYEGEFKAGKRHGIGTITVLTGFKYSGGWIDDKFSGNGKVTFSNGEQYVGQTANGMLNGKGTYTWPSGQKYTGNYVNDKQSGQGTLIYADGRKYIGSFSNNLFDGNGAFYDAKGVLVYQGLWENGSVKSSVSSTNQPNKSSADPNSPISKCNTYATKTKQDLKLPKAVDNITSAVDIFCFQGGNKPVFTYKYDVTSGEVFGQKSLDNYIRDKNKKLVCDTDLKMFLPVVDIEYQYFYGSNPSNFNPGGLIGKLRYTEADCSKNSQSSSGETNTTNQSALTNRVDLVSDRNNLNYSQRIQKYRNDIGQTIQKVDGFLSEPTSSMRLFSENLALRIESSQTWGFYGGQNEQIFIVFQNYSSNSLKGIQLKIEQNGCGKSGLISYRTLNFGSEIRPSAVVGTIFRRPNAIPLGQHCIDIVGLIS